MNKLKLILPMLFAFAILISLTNATTDNVGTTGGSFAGQGFNLVLASPVTASSGGTLSTVGLDIASGATGNFRVAIYADSGGVAGALLAESASTPMVDGWNDASLTNSITIVMGTQYWLAFQEDNGAPQTHVTTGTGTVYSFAQGYGSFPVAPAWTSNPSADFYDMRMTYATPSLTMSNTAIDQGQGILFTASTTGGSPTYSFGFNVYVFNTLTATTVLIANQLYTGNTYTSNSWFWQPAGDLSVGNTLFRGNVVISDGTPSSANSVSNSFGYNSAMTQPSITTPSPTTQQTGNTITWSTSFMGGTSAFTYNWVVINTITEDVFANMLETNSFTGNSFSYVIKTADAGNTIQANVIITDSASKVNVTVNSIESGTITIVASPTPPIVSISNIITPWNSVNTITVTPIFGSDGTNVMINNVLMANTFSGATSFNMDNLLIGSFTVIGCDTTYNVCNALTSNLIVYVPVYVANQSNIVSTVTPNGIYPAPIACANNWVGGNCIGNIVYTSSITLTNDLIVNGNVTIDSGQTLTTNGFSVIVSGTFNSLLGTVVGGDANNGGTGTEDGGSFPLSYGGSGGGSAGFGGNTLVLGTSGAGSTPAAPIVTTSNIAYWYNHGFFNYLSGAGGGGNNAGDGGGGSFGVYIQASNLIAGTITAIGGNGNGGFGGGAGGAIILLAYGSGGYTAGSYSVNGGTGSNAGGDGRALTYNYNLPPVPVQILKWYYPYKLYTTSPSANLNYSLNQSSNGIITIISTNVPNISYLPPSNQFSGLYFYNVTERQKGNTNAPLILSPNVSVNMTDVKVFGTVNAPAIQLYPIQISSNTLIFSVTPTSYKIDGYSNTVIGVNVIKGSPSNTLPINMSLTYPLATINVSNSVNPAVPNNIALQTFKLVNNTTGGSGIYTRQILTVNTYSEPLLTTLNAITQYSANFIINNYTTNTFSVLTPSYNSINIYVAQANFQNPSMVLHNQTLFSSTTSYVGRTNNPFDKSVPPVNTINIYLSQLANSTTFTVQAFGCGNSASTGFRVAVINSGAGSTVVQLYKITSTTGSFPLSLIGTGFPYQFILYNLMGGVVYTSPSAQPSSPIQLFANCGNQTVPTVRTANITVHCSSINQPLNTLLATCTGADTTGLASSFVVNFLNQSTVLTQTTINSVTINGNSFVTSFLFSSNKTTYYYKVTAIVGNVFDPQYIYTGSFNIVPQAPQPYDLVFAALLFILLPVAFAYFDRTVLIIVEIFAIIIGQAAGILFFTPTDVVGFIVIAVIMILMDERNT